MGNKILMKCSQATEFKLLFLSLALLSFNGLTANRTLLTMIAYFVSAIGFFVIAVRVVCFKRYLHAKGIFLLIAFCASYALSAFVTRQYGIMENIKALIWMALQYFVLYAYNTDSDGTGEKKEFRIIFNFFIVYTFIAVAVGIVMLYLNYYSYKEVNGVVVIIGFLWNRLWGIYSDPNYGAVFAAITVMICLYFLKGSKKVLKAFYILNIILQICYIAYSDSRTGLISLFCGIFAFVYLNFLKSEKIKSKHILTRGAASVLAAVVAISVSYGAVKGVSISTSNFKRYQYEHFTKDDDFKSEEQIKYENKNLEIGRQKEDINGDLSNRRFAIWKSGFEIFMSKPLTGVSFRNYVPYAEDKLPDTYIVNNDFDKFRSMHNSFVDIVVSQGILGIAVIVPFIVLVLAAIFKNFFKFSGEIYRYHTILISVITIITVSMMFYSETFYMNTGGAFLFWLTLGYLVQSIGINSGKNNTEKQ